MLRSDVMCPAAMRGFHKLTLGCPAARMMAGLLATPAVRLPDPAG